MGNQPSQSHQDEKAYLKPYEDATREMGASFESQLWLNRDAQRTRFEVLTQVGQFAGHHIADMGCGVGDLPMYLHQHQPDQFPAMYIGIEGVDDMASLARDRITQIGFADACEPRAMIDIADFVSDENLPELLVQDAQVDVFVFSGSLNTLAMIDAQSVLDRFWNALVHQGRGRLVFNFLSDRHDADRTPASAPAVRYDPAKMLDWALERTPITLLRHEYLQGHDATIVMNVQESVS